MVFFKTKMEKELHNHVKIRKQLGPSMTRWIPGSPRPPSPSSKCTPSFWWRRRRS
jgi:hypothetical protein